MKKIISLLIIIVVLGVIAVALKSIANKAVPAMTDPEPAVSTPLVSKVSGKPTDFVAVGVLTFLPANPPTYGVTLTYNEANITGTSSATSSLYFDELSSCAAPNGSQPCIEFNVPLDVPYNGKTVVVEGIWQGEGILVRKMTGQTGGLPLLPAPGRVFISWPQARMFITSCAPQSIMQTHDLDVTLRLADGTTLVAVEPVIDAVMKVAEAAREKCGAIPIATE